MQISYYLFVILAVKAVLIGSITCSSDSYCPAGWSILRRADGSATTCDPTDRERAKCPKPHMCIASKCGLKFCCANDKILSKLTETNEEDEENENHVNDVEL